MNRSEWWRRYEEARAVLPPESVLLFQVGESYTAYGDDANDVAVLCALPQGVQRIGRGKKDLVLTACFPVGEAEKIIDKLKQAGFSVFRCALQWNITEI